MFEFEEIWHSASKENREYSRSIKEGYDRAARRIQDLAEKQGYVSCAQYELILHEEIGYPNCCGSLDVGITFPWSAEGS